MGAGGRTLGQLEEYFIEQLSPGDTFVFRGRGAGLRRHREDAAFVSRTQDAEAQVPSYNGGNSAVYFPGCAGARDGVQAETWQLVARSGARMAAHSGMALGDSAAGQLLVETFPRATRHYLVCYPFEGRLAHRRWACC